MPRRRRRRADAAAKEVERSNTSAALDVALTQLAEVEAQMLAIMRPLSHDDREGLATSLKRLPSGLREGAEQIIARNSGGGWDFDLTQSGSTNKTYSLPHSMSDGTTTSGTCYNVSGCTLSVTQGD